MRKKKIAILTFQDKLELYDDQFKNTFDNIEVVQYGSDFSYEKLKKNAQKIAAMGYDSIVCRGYTAEAIREYVDIPITNTVNTA